MPNLESLKPTPTVCLIWQLYLKQCQQTPGLPLDEVFKVNFFVAAPYATDPETFILNGVSSHMGQELTRNCTYH